MSSLQNYDTIFDYIVSQESQYKKPIPINESWNWSMYDHILLTDLYKNSKLKNGQTEFTPIKNITRPILNLEHRTEDIELEEVGIYVDDPSKYHLSFLVKKYHDDVFVVENDVDTFFDELNISRIDYGGGLSKQVNGVCPEVVPLQSIAFCDQSDMLSGPIGLKHHFSPDQLLAMADRGWGDKNKGATVSLEDLILLSREEKKETQNNQTTETPGRYIEIYEVHGNLPKRFANPLDTSGKYETRLFICAFYQRKNSMEKKGVILYTALEPKSPFKLIKRDPVYGRALGFGGAEELFEPQVWVNYDMIRMQDMLDAAAKTIMITQDGALVAKHPTGMKGMDNMEIIEESPNGNTRQLDTFPRNLRLFEKSIADWEAHAQQMGAANDSIMGKSPTSGTPFKLQELVTNESRGLHEYRRKQYAKHIELLYTCEGGILESIAQKITQGRKWLSTLSVKELNYVSDCLVRNQTAKFNNERVLNGELPMTPEEEDAYKQKIRDDFKAKGNKHFIEILKSEFKNVKLSVKVSVAGKSKNLSLATDKIVNIFRFAFSNPAGFAQVMQIPGMADGFNQILEFSGLSPVDFAGIEKLAIPPETSPLQPEMATQ